MSAENRVNVTGGNAQVGGRNTNINPTINNNPTTNIQPTINNYGVHVSFNYYLGNDPQPVAQHSTTSNRLTREQRLKLQQLSQSGLLPEDAVQQVTDVVERQQSTQLTSQSCDECIIRTRPQCSKCGQRTTPGQSVPPPTQSVEESTQPPESPQPPQSPQSRRPLSDHQQSRNRKRAADRKQISSQRNKLTDVQPSNQTPGCSESDQTSRVLAEERVPSTQPGNMQVVGCDEETQKVIMEKLDVSRQFSRVTPYSFRRCKIFPAQMRVDRARYTIQKVSPLRETCQGRDFVYRTCTGLNCEQAWNKGFWLS